MIELLKISSMTVFEETTLEFEPGLNCITGETGAGKSLVVGALTLLMGAKTGADLVRPGCDKAVIEALFTQNDQECVLRREIGSNGRSRCYVNGELATLESLALKAASLVQIYGQHQYQDLLNPKEHMPILEDLAGLDRSAVVWAYAELKASQEALIELEERINFNLKRRDELVFSLSELEACPLEPGLEAELEHRLKLSRAAAVLKDGVERARELCYLASGSLHEQASQLRRILSDLSATDAELGGALAQSEEILALLEDLNITLGRKADTYDYDQQTIDQLDDQLHQLRNLKRKHNRDEIGLLELRQEFKQALALITDSDEQREQAGLNRDRAWTAYRETLTVFCLARQDYAATFCENINQDLSDLGMPGVRFGLSQAWDNLPEAWPGSLDQLAPARLLTGEFLIATNRGQRQQPLAKIASGGELSRIMLAIKVQQKGANLSAMIFDEIDAGISGQTAFLVAERLKTLADDSQAIVVTHLHQVAATASAHFNIVKAHSASTTTSAVTKLSRDERVEELARMMGGENPSLTVIDHARELLANR